MNSCVTYLVVIILILLIGFALFTSVIDQGRAKIDSIDFEIKTFDVIALDTSPAKKNYDFSVMIEWEGETKIIYSDEAEIVFDSSIPRNQVEVRVHDEPEYIVGLKVVRLILNPDIPF